MKESKETKIIVIGNEKGGAGKTTFAMHLIIGLLDKGFKVASIDTDVRQKSLTSYMENREKYNKQNPNKMVAMPMHFCLKESTKEEIQEKDLEEKHLFETALSKSVEYADYVVIDTPGSHTNYSRIAHSYADMVITPINDSFIDLDVMAKIDGNNFDVTRPSIYSEMLWQQKMERASRDKGTIDWIIVRNRLSNIDAQNKRNINDTLEKMSKRMGFKIAPGLSERVIFRELFPYGLTLLDLTRANFNKSFSISHVAARQELRDFLEFIK